MLCRDIGWGCKCAMSWSDLELTFQFTVVTLTIKILSRQYLRICMVIKVVIWYGNLSGILLCSVIV